MRDRTAEMNNNSNNKNAILMFYWLVQVDHAISNESENQRAYTRFIGVFLGSIAPNLIELFAKINQTNVYEPKITEKKSSSSSSPKFINNMNITHCIE